MVSLKLWGEKYGNQIILKWGKKKIKEHLLMLISNCKREDSYNEKKLIWNIIWNIVTGWQFVSNDLHIRVFFIRLLEVPCSKKSVIVYC